MVQLSTPCNRWRRRRTTRYQYDAVGNQTAVIDPLARVSRSEYDRLNRLLKSIDPDADGPGGQLPHATTFKYDAAGQLIEEKETNGAGETKTFAYDPRGRLIRSTDGLGDATVRRYDAAGNLTRLTDPAGNATSYVYDKLDRVVTEATASGTRQFLYDVNGNLATQIDRNGRVVKRSFDGQDRTHQELWYTDLATSQAAAGSLWSDDIDTFYDDLGRTIEQQHRHRDLVAGSYAFSYRLTDSYRYDRLDRLTEQTNQSLSSAFHSTGVPATRQTYAYGHGVQTREQHVAGAFAARTVSTFNAFGELAKLEDRDTNASGTASAILDFEGTDAAFEYWADGALKTTSRYTDWDATLSGYRNEARSSYAYDGAGRLNSQSHQQRRRTTAAWPAYQSLVSFGYGYDAASRINAQSTDWNTGLAAFSTRTAELQTFAYDAAGQLTTVDSSLAGGDAAYGYTANGNRGAVIEPGGGSDSYSTGPQNRVSEDSTHRYHYDAEGNLTRREELFDTSTYTTYVWDHRNRLIKVDEWSNDHHIRYIDYRYDAAGNLVYRSHTPADVGIVDSVEHYVAENGRRTMTVQPDGDVIRRYQHGPQGQVLFDQQFDGTGNPALQAEQDLLLPLGDHQNSTRVVLAHDANDASYVLQSLDYAEFGRVTAIRNAAGALVETSPGVPALAAVVTAYAHHGSLLDVATGLQLKGQRWYSPDLGRFISEDPIQDGANWYRFAGNDPVNYGDPTGLYQAGHPLQGGSRGFDNAIGGLVNNPRPTATPTRANTQTVLIPQFIREQQGFTPLPSQVHFVQPPSLLKRMGNAAERRAERAWSGITSAGRVVEREVNLTTEGLRINANERFDGNLSPTGPLARVGNAYRATVHTVANGIDSTVYNANVPVRVEEDYTAYQGQGVAPRDAGALAVSRRLPGGSQFLMSEELLSGRSNQPGEVNRPLEDYEKTARGQNLMFTTMGAVVGYFANRGNGGRGGNVEHAEVQRQITLNAGGRQEVRVYEGGNGTRYRVVDNVDAQSRYHQVGDMRYRGGRYSPSAEQRGAIEDLRHALGKDATIIYHDKLGRGPTLINPDLQPSWRPAPARHRTFGQGQ